MPLRLTDLVKRTLRRPVRRPLSAHLRCETLEDRTVPALVYQDVFDLAGVDGTVQVTATVTDDTPGQYLWEYHVENISFIPMIGSGPGIGLFIVGTDGAGSVDAGVGNLDSSVGWDEFLGVPPQDPTIAYWWNLGSGTGDILVGGSGDFSFTTPVVSIAIGAGYAYESGFGSGTFGYLAVPGQPVVFDLDVNADGDLADPVDGAANYLPGYEGTTPKVSIGSTFNSDSYQRQRMKLILEGFGTATPNITRVTFELVPAETSSHPGYASNRTHASIQAAGTQYDYSFLPNQDYFTDPANPAIITTIIPASMEQQRDGLPVGGQMQPNRTWINLYAKDYGGATQAKVTVYHTVGGVEQVNLIATLDVPKDTDNDGFADKWEVEMAARWATQYLQPAFTDAEALAKFAPQGAGGPQYTQDDEEQDPDGIGTGRDRLVSQAEVGDAHTILEEYRGYILDGGGLDGAGQNGHAGGHIRLDPARKEILLEVDRTAVLNNLPATLPAILDGAAKVFSNADRGAGIYLYYLFDELALATPTRAQNDSSEALEISRDTASARLNATPILATDFIHVLFVDKDLGNSADNRDTGALVRRGVTVSTTEMNAKYGPGNAFGVVNIPEAFMTVVAHEITHSLFERRSVGVWDDAEHVTGPLATYEAELMYQPPTKKNRELATVTILPIVQQEIKVKSNQGIV
jgi:hypothetical protein